MVRVKLETSVFISNKENAKDGNLKEWVFLTLFENYVSNTNWDPFWNFIWISGFVQIYLVFSWKSWIVLSWIYHNLGNPLPSLNKTQAFPHCHEKLRFYYYFSLYIIPTCLPLSFSKTQIKIKCLQISQS